MLKVTSLFLNESKLFSISTETLHRICKNYLWNLKTWYWFSAPPMCVGCSWIPLLLSSTKDKLGKLHQGSLESQLSGNKTIIKKSVKDIVLFGVWHLVPCCWNQQSHSCFSSNEMNWAIFQWKLPSNLSLRKRGLTPCQWETAHCTPIFL